MKKVTILPHLTVRIRNTVQNMEMYCNVLCDLVLSPGADALHDPDPDADQGRARAAGPQHGHAPTGRRLECHAHAPGPAALQQALLRAGQAPGDGEEGQGGSVGVGVQMEGVLAAGLALKNPPKKKKNHLKNPLKMGF